MYQTYAFNMVEWGLEPMTLACEASALPTEL